MRGYHYRRAAIANWKVVVINAGMRKGFSYRRTAIVAQGLLGLEAVLFDEAEESVLVHL